MTSAVDEAAVRRWLVDYLVTNNGCSPEQIDAGASMHDLGVGSRDAVVLTGVLSEFVGRTVSPVDFWQYPTVDALAKFLTGGEGEPAARTDSKYVSTSGLSWEVFTRFVGLRADYRCPITKTMDVMSCTCAKRIQ